MLKIEIWDIFALHFRCVQNNSHQSCRHNEARLERLSKHPTSPTFAVLKSIKNEDPTFTRDLFGLKINQGGGGFRPYSERINFLNCTSNTLPQLLDLVPKEGDTKKGL